MYSQRRNSEVLTRIIICKWQGNWDFRLSRQRLWRWLSSVMFRLLYQVDDCPFEGGTNTSETSINSYQTTWRNIREGSHLHLNVIHISSCMYSKNHIHFTVMTNFLVSMRKIVISYYCYKFRNHYYHLALMCLRLTLWLLVSYCFLLYKSKGSRIRKQV